MTVLVVLEAGVIAVLGLLVAGLLRSHAEILRALHDAGISLDPDQPAGHRAPVPAPRVRAASSAGPAHDLAGVDPRGDAVAVGVVGVAHRTLIAFLSSGCLTCAGFWQAFRDEASLGLPDGVRLAVVTKGPDHESPAAVAQLAPPRVPVVMSSDAWLAYEVPVSPYFVLVDGPGERVVGEGAAAEWAQVVSLLAQALKDQDGPAARGRWRPRADAEREEDVDRALLAAGIQPGDPRLYQQPGSRPDQRA